MANGQTRTFAATYTSSDKKKHKLGVRVFHRLGRFGLSISLIRKEETCHLTGDNSKKTANAPKGQELSRDLQLIEDIKLKQEAKVKSMDSKENEIDSLESYFHDYLMNSSVACIAKSPTEANKDQSNFYKSVLFGTPKNEKETDKESIYGKYVEAYLDYHSKQSHTREEQTAYIEKLTELEKKVDADLNLGGTINTIVTYSDFTRCLAQPIELDKNFI